jgi:hypothetical protein
MCIAHCKGRRWGAEKKWILHSKQPHASVELRTEKLAPPNVVTFSPLDGIGAVNVAGTIS